MKIRLPEDLVLRIDAERGDVPRERWVRRTLEEALVTRSPFGESAPPAPAPPPASGHIAFDYGHGEPCPSCGFMGGEHDFDCERNTNG
jgi:hypothetical protein